MWMGVEFFQQHHVEQVSQLELRAREILCGEIERVCDALLIAIFPSFFVVGTNRQLPLNSARS
jgi:hypothetical protein